MGDFVPDNPADGGVIEVGRTVLAEEGSLQDASGEFCAKKLVKHVTLKGSNVWLRTNAVLEGRVVGVDDGRPAVRDPIGLVNGLTQPFEGVVRAEHGEIERVA